MFIRLYCRLVVFPTNTLLVSDVLIAVAIVVDIAMCLMIHMQIQTGMGRHIQYSQARPAMLQESMKVGLAENSLYQAALPSVCFAGIHHRLLIFTVSPKAVFLPSYTPLLLSGCSEK